MEFLPRLGHVQVGPHICMFKTHVDIFDHWDASVAEKLRQIADKHSTSLLPYCSLLHHAIPPCNAIHKYPAYEDTVNVQTFKLFPITIFRSF